MGKILEKSCPVLIRFPPFGVRTTYITLVGHASREERPYRDERGPGGGATLNSKLSIRQLSLELARRFGEYTYMARPSDTSRTRLWFKIGIGLLVLNVPFGYGGMAAAAALAVVTEEAWWALVGAGIYGLSWLMLGAGLLLTGAEGLEYIKGFRGRFLRRRHDKTCDSPNSEVTLTTDEPHDSMGSDPLE